MLTICLTDEIMADTIEFVSGHSKTNLVDKGNPTNAAFPIHGMD